MPFVKINLLSYYYHVRNVLQSPLSVEWVEKFRRKSGNVYRNNEVIITEMGAHKQRDISLKFSKRKNKFCGFRDFNCKFKTSLVVWKFII